MSENIEKSMENTACDNDKQFDTGKLNIPINEDEVSICLEATTNNLAKNDEISVVKEISAEECNQPIAVISNVIESKPTEEYNIINKTVESTSAHLITEVTNVIESTPAEHISESSEAVDTNEKNYETNSTESTEKTTLEESAESTDKPEIPVDADNETITAKIQNNDIAVHSSDEIQNEKLEDKQSIPTDLQCNNTANLHAPLPRSLVIDAQVIKAANLSSSLSLLQSQYTDSEESDSDDDVQENIPANEIFETIAKEYRGNIVEIDSECSSSDSDIEIITTEEIRQKINDLTKDDDDDVDDDDDDNVRSKKRRGPVRVKGELLLEDLPPIEDLKITVAEEECVELGKIHSVVDQLVLVDSLPGTVPLNLDTVLFLEKGQKVLGEVFDVLGQISSPIYCVRFNSNEQIVEKGIQIGEIVYVAPRTEHTQFIILSSIMNIRGSDASWENDIEPSARHMEFSDDEEERSYRRSLRNKEHNDRNPENNDSNKRQRSTSTSSSVISDTDSVQSNMSNQYVNNYRGRGRGGYQRFPRPVGPNQSNVRGNWQMPQQFPPRNYYPPNNNRFHNPSSFNYNQSGSTWHSNYNFNDFSPNYRNNNPRQHSMQPNNFQQPYPPQYHPGLTQTPPPNMYPNPYALRSSFVPPNTMQQPLFPPPPQPPPPSSEN